MVQKRATSTTALVSAAAKVFLRKGFEASTIDDVAREAGISKPTVYQYAESKQWLLDEVARVMCDGMEREQLRLHSESAPAIVRLHWLLDLHVELALKYRHSYRLTLSEQNALSPEAQKAFRLWARRTTARFADLLSECREAGAFNWSGDTLVAANLILSMLTATHRWYHSRDGEIDESLELADQVRTLLSGAIAKTDMSLWPRPNAHEVSEAVIALG